MKVNKKETFLFRSKEQENYKNMQSSGMFSLIRSAIL